MLILILEIYNNHYHYYLMNYLNNDLMENQYKTGDYTTTFSTLMDLVYFLESDLLHNLLKNSNMFDRVVIEYNGEVIINADKIIDKLI